MRMRLAVVAALCTALASCAALHACTVDSSPDCASSGPCPPDAGTEASTDTSSFDTAIDAVPDGQEPADTTAGRGDSSDGFTCDPTKSPHDDPCVIDNAYGVFVAPGASGGSDTAGNGTQAEPFATIGRALVSLNGKGRVYICGGTYDEQLTLSVSAATSLYGGLACPGLGAALDWSYVGLSSLARVLSPSSDWAVKIDGVGSPIAIEDVSFTAPNASGQDTSGNGKSSIAALVNASTVTFRRCALTAGSGDKGQDGTTGQNFPASATTAADGNASDGGIGGAGGTGTCSDGTSSAGGRGGSASADGGAPGGDGTASPMPSTSAPVDGLGGSGGLSTCIRGDPGANGDSGDAGVAAANYGVLNANGWTPSVGGAGQAGRPGQGGGGGGGFVSGGSPVGGIGGGSGGCGGAGGRGGAGGGASIALACIGSSVTLDACVLTTSIGGNGGHGGDGQPGQGGGHSSTAILACRGGVGGIGGDGCGGAGGTGGISVCVAFRDLPPIGSRTCITGNAGVAGSGGSGDAGVHAIGRVASAANGADGLPGLAQAILQVP